MHNEVTLVSTAKSVKFSPIVFSLVVKKQLIFYILYPVFTNRVLYLSEKSPFDSSKTAFLSQSPLKEASNNLFEGNNVANHFKLDFPDSPLGSP